jgi:hypothetical protein
VSASLYAFDEKGPTKPGLRLQPKPFSYLRLLLREPEWLWRGFLARGSLTLLSGQPFVGKSTLVSGLLRAMAVGEPFLGQPTQPATALLVNEEDETQLGERAELFKLFELHHQYLARRETVRCDWPTLIEQATQAALEADHRLLVIDTFPGLAGLSEKQENDAGAIGERLRPLQQAAAADLSVLFLHHMNAFGQPRGSSAFRGTVDISARLLRSGKNRAFRLETQSRFLRATTLTLTGELVTGKGEAFYRVREARGAAHSGAGSTDDLLWETLTKAGPAGLSYGDLDLIEGLSRDIAKKRFPTWRRQGKVGCRGGGAKNDPFRWYVRT